MLHSRWATVDAVLVRVCPWSRICIATLDHDSHAKTKDIAPVKQKLMLGRKNEFFIQVLAIYQTAHTNIGTSCCPWSLGYDFEFASKITSLVYSLSFVDFD
jgi:hypothetical protein